MKAGTFAVSVYAANAMCSSSPFELRREATPRRHQLRRGCVHVECHRFPYDVLR